MENKYKLSLKRNNSQNKNNTRKKGKYNNLNNLSKGMANFVLKKRVSFKNNNKFYNVPKEEENILARKSIRRNETSPLTSENEEMYSHKRATLNENRIRRRITKEYLKKLHKKGKYHLNNTNKNLIEEMVEKETGSFWE